MKVELEILEQDLNDRQIMIDLRNVVEDMLVKLTEFSKNNCANQINNLRSAIEQVENAWLFNQRTRMENKLSEALNVEVSRMGVREYHDYY